MGTKKVQIHSGFRTPQITREFASELLDVKMDSLQASFPGRVKPTALAEDELEALGFRWHRGAAINELRDQVKHHIRYGGFYVAEHNDRVVGFALVMPERLTFTSLVRQTAFRQKPKVKLNHLYMRETFHELPDSELKPAIVQLGERALEGYNPVEHRIISFAAASQDWVIPGTLHMLGMELYPASQKPRLDTTTFGDQDDPLYVYKYEARSMTDRA